MIETYSAKLLLRRTVRGVRASGVGLLVVMLAHCASAPDSADESRTEDSSLATSMSIWTDSARPLVGSYGIRSNGQHSECILSNGDPSPDAGNSAFHRNWLDASDTNAYGYVDAEGLRERLRGDLGRRDVLSEECRRAVTCVRARPATCACARSRGCARKHPREEPRPGRAEEPRVRASMRDRPWRALAQPATAPRPRPWRARS